MFSKPTFAQQGAQASQSAPNAQGAQNPTATLDGSPFGIDFSARSIDTMPPPLVAQDAAERSKRRVRSRPATRRAKPTPPSDTLSALTPFDAVAYAKNFQFTPLFSLGFAKPPAPKVRPTHAPQGDIKRLIIDPEVSAAKRRKLASGRREIVSQTKKNPQAPSESRKSRFLGFGLKQIKAVLGSLDTKKASESSNIDYDASDKGYWCSPPVSVLAKMPFSELCSVENFVVGRKKYGQVAFESAVDLVDFAKLGKTPAEGLRKALLCEGEIRFLEKNVLQVYSDPATKPPRGQGMNVPALVTLEGVFPNGVPREECKDFHFQKLLARLKQKSQREMEFVNYVMETGSWAFRVPHFSFWGLIDEDDDENDAIAEPISKATPKDIDTKAETEAPQEKKYEKPASTVKKSDEKSLLLAEEVVKNMSNKARRASEKSCAGTPEKPFKKARKEPLEFDLLIQKKPLQFPGAWNFNYGDIDDLEGEAEAETNETEEPKKDENQSNPILEKKSEAKQEARLETKSEAQLDLTKKDEENLPIAQLEIPEKELEDLELSGSLDSEEKLYEPLDLEETDFEALTVHPPIKLQEIPKASPWEKVFKLCEEEGEDSVFNPKLQHTIAQKAPRLPFSAPKEKTIAYSDLDNALFKNLNEKIANYTKAKKDLKLKGKSFAVFDHGKIIRGQETLNPYGELPLEAVFEAHFRAADLVTRPNGYPAVAKRAALGFEVLRSAPQDGKLWELALRLCDDSRVESAAAAYDSSAARHHVMNLCRVELVKEWFQEAVASETALKLGSDIFQRVFMYLCQGRLEEASAAALEGRNPHLSVLITMLGLNNASVKFGARQQLEWWERNGESVYVSEWILKIYKLLSGSFLGREFDVDVGEGLSWKVVYMMVLLYGNYEQSLAELSAEFVKIYAEKGQKDPEFLLVRAASLLQGTLDSASIQQTLASFSSGGLDYSVEWYVYTILFWNRGFLDQSLKTYGDRLALAFVDQLLASGCWTYAMFVCMHLEDHQTAERYISMLVHENITQVVDFESEDVFASGKLAYMTQTYKLPELLAPLAVALRYRYLGDYVNEAYALIEAQNWGRAANVVLQKVAPLAVIRGGKHLDRLLKLILVFPERMDGLYELEEWSLGLGIYKNYLLLALAGGDSEYCAAMVGFLALYLPRLKQDNDNIRVAAVIMSKLMERRACELGRADLLTRGRRLILA